jgi:hypothetical protein
VTRLYAALGAGSTSASGENQRWAIAVGTIAESTTTVTSSENRPERQPVDLSGVVNVACWGT